MIYHILFSGLFIYFVIIFLWLQTIDMYFMYRSSTVINTEHLAVYDQCRFLRFVG